MAIDSLERGLSLDEGQKQALKRARELKDRISDYLAVKDFILSGREWAEEIEFHKQRLLKLLGGTGEEWLDWRWQMRKRITTVEVLARFMELNRDDIHDIDKVSRQYRWAVSPYYAAVMAVGGGQRADLGSGRAVDGGDHRCPRHDRPHGGTVNVSRARHHPAISRPADYQCH
ncbi:hypothetical protein [Candidatus Desulforudis audaxviator]